MYKLPSGPSAFFDIDDTLVIWSNPTGNEKLEELVTVVTRGLKQTFLINRFNLKYLRELAVRGHSIVLWSQGGSDWCEAVAKALDIEDLVCACLSKPMYYIDDIKDTSQFMGKYVFFDENGVSTGYVPKKEDK
jgi:hypothetical protein